MTTPALAAAFDALTQAEKDAMQAGGLAACMAWLDRLEREDILPPPKPGPTIRVSLERRVAITEDGAEHPTLLAAMRHAAEATPKT